MPPAPRVSVILPCFNAGSTLPAALTSLLGQTLGDFELIAVDDGSTDDTWDILTAFASRDARDSRESRILPLRLPHAGVARANNAAVAKARAQYIARMDADDLCLPRRLETQAALLDADASLGLVSGLVRFGGDSKTARGYSLHVDWLNTLQTPEDISLNRFVESPVANPSVMFRREVYERLGGCREPDPSGPSSSQGQGAPFPEDYEMWLRWLEAGVRMGKVDEEVLVWNDPPERLTRTHPDYSPAAFARVKAEYLWRWLARHNPRHPQVHAWGAGRVSRQRLAHLTALGLEIEAYVDIDPQKIGQRIGNIPVLPRESLPPFGPSAPFILVNVGSRGAREEITAWLAGRGYQMGVGALAMG